MTNPFRPGSCCDEPLVPRSLGTLAAALASCAHPEVTQVWMAIDPAAGAAAATWCAACGALHAHGSATASWQSPFLASRLTRRPFEDLVLLLHAIVQLTQLVQSQGSPGAVGSSAQTLLRNVRASLSELSRLPVVRDLDRLEDAIAAMPVATAGPSGIPDEARRC